MKKKSLLFIFAFLSIVGWGPFSFLSGTSNVSHAPVGSKQWLAHETQIINEQAKINPAALKTSLTAYQKARAKGLDNKQLLTIIDYSKPSNERRLWVVDLKKQKVLLSTWVAHGKNSGQGVPTSFSNNTRSLKSSLGVFLTSSTYTGKHGRSLRIQGLERGVNDNAYRRDIVFHGASYAGAKTARSRKMLGRSWGCMAVGEDTIQPLINIIKDKTLVVAYYPDQKWLRKSSFLT